MTTETSEIALLKKRIAELEAALHAGVDRDDACPPNHCRFQDADRQREEAGAKDCPDGVFPASRTTLQAILNAAPEPILLLDTKGIVLAANSALAQRFQTPLEEIIGTDPYRLLPPDIAAGRRQHVEKAIAGGQPLHFQDERLGRTYEHYLYPLKDANGSVIQVAIYSMEITERATAAKALLHSQALLNATEKLAHVGGWEWDIARQAMAWTKETYRIHGLAHKPHSSESTELIEKSISCYDPADRPVIRAAFLRCAEQGEPYDLELPFTSVQGQRLWIRTTGKAVRSKGKIALVRGNIVDITQDRQKAELLKARLRISEAAGSLDLQKLMRMILDETEKLTGSHIGFFHFYDAKRKSISLQAWSTATSQTSCAVHNIPWHYSLEEAGVWADCIRQNRPVIHNNYNELPHRKGIPAGHAPVIRELVVPVKRNNEIVAILGIGNKAHDYDQKDVELVTTLANLAFDTVLQKQAEMALREQAEAALRASLAEKEVLLREVHHRVKNNLAAIIGLFDLQRHAPWIPQALTVLTELAAGSAAMSLIHEKLYRSDNLARIDFQDVPHSLISHLRTSFGSLASAATRLPGAWMPLDLAVPCGMIINELVTNALKYAFPDGQPASGRTLPHPGIALRRENDTFTLTVADNGIGLPPGFDWTAPKPWAWFWSACSAGISWAAAIG
jgi:two-component sensor histidine kinase/PAS domain-containing protein/putative methionine-R-sulfoxide reductase with GAF domain